MSEGVSTFVSCASRNSCVDSKDGRLLPGASPTADILSLVVLSMEARPGTSRLCRGLAAAEAVACEKELTVGDWVPLLAATARASLSWSRSFARDDDLDCGAGDFAGCGGAAGAVPAAFAASSVSERILSRRASTPATAWDSSDPHRVPF